MWEKLLGLLKEKYPENENYIPASIAKRDARKQELLNSVPVSEPEKSFKNEPGKGTLIGYNYLKGLDEKDNSERTRRFINLTKFLRGDYNVRQIETPNGEQKSNLRGEDSE